MKRELQLAPRLALLALAVFSAMPAAAAPAPTPEALIAWGYNCCGQTDVPLQAQSGVKAIAAGGLHTLALRTNGSVVAWGYNPYGQATPPSTTQSGIIAIAAGGNHSLALKSNGSVIAWGYNSSGQTTVPVAAQSGVMAIAAGEIDSVALKTNGSVVTWGGTGFLVGTQNDVRAISAGFNYIATLKTNGRVVAWGNACCGQTNVPPSAQTGVSAIAAGTYHMAALKSNGCVLVWGDNFYGQTNVPPSAQSGVKAIAAGRSFTLALKTDGSVVAWGQNDYGATNLPSVTRNGVAAISAGAYHGTALVPRTKPVILTPPSNQTVSEDQSASFTVDASGPYLSYQWRQNGIPINGAINSTLIISAAQTNQSGGGFAAVVSNPIGSVTSAPPALLTVSSTVTAVFVNSDAIAIPDVGTGDPYPSILAVSGIGGPVAKLQAALHNFSHSYPRDVEVLLMAPSGRVATLMARAGGTDPVAESFLFDDDSELALNCCEMISGAFHPTDLAGCCRDLPPGGIDSPETSLAYLTTNEVNGDWKLFVNDCCGGDSGGIESWSLVFHIASLPKLKMQSSADGVVLRWPASIAGVHLQSAPDLAPPVLWSDVEIQPVREGNEWAVTNSFSEGALFFRLKIR